MRCSVSFRGSSLEKTAFESSYASVATTPALAPVVTRILSSERRAGGVLRQINTETTVTRQTRSARVRGSGTPRRMCETSAALLNNAHADRRSCARVAA